MMRVPSLILRGAIVLCLCSLVTGCWDRTELNDRALIIASGIDWAPEGEIRFTDQILIPHSLMGQQSGIHESFATVSATGKNVLDAAQKLQTKLSRRQFLGHRRNIFIGEKLARQGLSGIMDEFTRNPDTRLHSDVFVVKGSTAAQVLQIQSSMEKYPAVAITKSRRNVGGAVGTTLVTFLMATNSDTSCATLPVVTITQEDPISKFPTLDFAGRGIFNRDLQLVGYLNFPDASLRLWMNNALKLRQQTFYVHGTSDVATVDLFHFRGAVSPTWRHGLPQFQVRLSANGIIRENNSHLQVTTPHAIDRMERSVNQEIEDDVSQMIHRVQRNYGTDIFGFDQAVARSYPKAWKTLKYHWLSVFPEISVSVRSDIKIRSVGSTREDPAMVNNQTPW